MPSLLYLEGKIVVKGQQCSLINLQIFMLLSVFATTRWNCHSCFLFKSAIIYYMLYIYIYIYIDTSFLLWRINVLPYWFYFLQVLRGYLKYTSFLLIVIEPKSHIRARQSYSRFLYVMFSVLLTDSGEDQEISAKKEIWKPHRDLFPDINVKKISRKLTTPNLFYSSLSLLFLYAIQQLSRYFSLWKALKST